MDRIQKPTQAQLEIKRSLFTADVTVMLDEDLIKPYLESLKALYPKSHHIAYAAFLDEGQIQKYSDDGEPKGTAGLPILDAIQYYDVTDIIVTVRRDFGGVLLGASGLVRAYKEAAHEALKKITRLKKKTTHHLSVVLSYKEYDLLTPIIRDWVLEAETTFTETVKVEGVLLKDEMDAFKALLNEKLNRDIDIEFGPEVIQYLADK